MPTQNYANHRRTHLVFHRVLIPVLALTILGATVNLVKSLDDHERLYSASLIVVLSICVFVMAILARVFALTAQDRAIRAEENLRHYLLTGKPLDGRLTVKQTVALRFASDGEMPALAARAATENLAPDAIKQSVKDWRADEYRV
jgi:hypothetical protein